MLDAYKRLHDSKKRGQRSLAEVPMEHLAKARQRQVALKGRLCACAVAGVDDEAHGQIRPRLGAQERFRTGTGATRPRVPEVCLDRSHHSTRGEAQRRKRSQKESTCHRCEVLTHLPQKPQKTSQVCFKWVQLFLLLNLRKKTDLVLVGHFGTLATGAL